DFCLRFAGDKQRDGLIERKSMVACAIHRAKLDAIEGESSVLHGSCFVRLFSLAIAGKKDGLCVRKYRCVKGDRLFCFSAGPSNEHEYGRYCLLYLIVACVNNLP